MNPFKQKSLNPHGFDFFSFTESQKLTPEIQEKIKGFKLVKQGVKHTPHGMEIVEVYSVGPDRWERFRRNAGSN